MIGQRGEGNPYQVVQISYNIEDYIKNYHNRLEFWTSKVEWQKNQMPGNRNGILGSITVDHTLNMSQQFEAAATSFGLY